MFLRVVLLSISILLSPIAKSMDSNKGTFALGVGATLAVIGSATGYFANKYNKVRTGNVPYEGPCTIDWAASKTWKITDNHQKAIPIVSFHPETVSDPFPLIIQTISPSWLEFLTGNGTYKLIDNRVLTKLEQSNFSGIIAALTHQPDTPDNPDQLHIFNINSKKNECIVRMWRKEDYSADNSDVLNYKLPKITPEHTQKKINFGNHYLFITTLDAEKHLQSGCKRMTRKNTSFIEKFTLLAAKKLCKDFNEETILNYVLNSTIASSKDVSDAFETLNAIAKQSKETGHSGAKMLLHIKK